MLPATLVLSCGLPRPNQRRTGNNLCCRLHLRGSTPLSDCLEGWTPVPPAPWPASTSRAVASVPARQTCLRVPASGSVRQFEQSLNPRLEGSGRTSRRHAAHAWGTSNETTDSCGDGGSQLPEDVSPGLSGVTPNSLWVCPNP